MKLFRASGLGAVLFLLIAPAAFSEPPQNDAFINGITLSGYSIATNATTAGATMEPGEFRWADNRGGHSIWYSWTAPDAGTCWLTGTGPGSGLLFCIYVGGSLGGATNNQGGVPGTSLTIVVANAFSGYGAPTSFHAVAGTTYRISVDGFQGEQGAVSFNLELTPANDRFADATTIFGDHFATLASSRGATRESVEPAHGGLEAGCSVWWNWTAPASGPVTLACASTNMQPVLAVYTGLNVTNLTLVASTNPATTGLVVLQFSANAGETYSIGVDGSSERGTTFSLELSMALVRITAPLGGQVFPHPANLRPSAQVPPAIAGIDVLEFYDNGQLLATVTNPPFNFSWQNISPGGHTLLARGIDSQGRTNVSLPVSVLVSTNNTFPTPKLNASWTSSYVIDAMGNLHVWGLNGMGHYGLSGSLPDLSMCEDPFDPGCPEAVPEKLWYPQIAKFPSGVTGWQSVSGSWGLGNNGRLYQYGVLSFDPAPGSTAWRYLNRGFMMDDLGRLYYDGVLRNPQGPYPWMEVLDGMLMTTNRELYQLDGTNFNVLPFPAGVTAWKTASCASHCLALGNNGQLYAWGYNYSGQLGLGDKVDRPTPTRVPPPAGTSNWTAIAAGGNHSLAIADDGQLYAWGRNWENQLGIGYTPNQTVERPYKVVLPVGVTKWTAITAGFAHSLAIGDDCQLYAWGGNGDGQLGTGPGPSPPYPARVPGIGSLCGIPVIVTGSSSRLPNGDFLVEFPTDLNRSYNIQYSVDTQNWTTVFPALLGTGGLIDWIDDGPPKTDSPPGNQPTRFYRVVVAQ